MPELSRNTQLMVKWYIEHPDGFVPMERKPARPPDPSGPQHILLPHIKWVVLKCFCCKKHNCVSGLWHLIFSSHEAIHYMCAACGMYEAYRKWSGGFMRKKLKYIRVLATVTYK